MEKEDPGVIFKKEKDLVSQLDNHQRKVVVQILLRISLAQGLTLLAHHSSFNLHNH